MSRTNKRTTLSGPSAPSQDPYAYPGDIEAAPDQQHVERERRVLQQQAKAQRAGRDMHRAAMVRDNPKAKK